MVFHDQNYDISAAISALNQELSYLVPADICIHTGPIIRKEEIYEYEYDETNEPQNDIIDVDDYE